ncbi:MAG: SEC-C metal-binding domain-containing protein, partial [Pseudomonadales bacterium]
IATNMAGRGTDIILGGNWEAEVAALDNPDDQQTEKVRADWQADHAKVLEAGGLHVIGTERHESRRIDNQLRGRSGRQGDPGYSRFYLSLEDDLMRIFASDRVRGFMQGIGMEKGEAIEHRMVTNAIEKAQRKVEGRNFDIRKQLLEYDDVANDQRQMIYRQRHDLIEADDIADTLDALWDDVVNQVIDGFIPPQSLEEQWDIPGLEQALHTEFNASLPVHEWLDKEDGLLEEGIRQRVVAAIRDGYERKTETVGPDIRLLEKRIMLDILDGLWKEHLAAMDHLRQGIHLRAYAQKQPKNEYKREAFELFEGLLGKVRSQVVRVLSRVQLEESADPQALERRRREQQERANLRYSSDEGAPAASFNKESALAGGVAAAASGNEAPVAGKAPAASLNKESPAAVPRTPYVRKERKVGRNEPCPCGSGKKYKTCHGKIA